MYKDYYRFQTEPFSTHPNTGTFYVSMTHKEAWYYLLFGIDTQEPFLVLTGEYGMGKTLLCLRLVKVLKEKGVPWVEFIPTSNEGYGGILRRIALNLGISPLAEDEEILQEMIYDRFRADSGNRRFYLIIDDAHELDITTLTKLKYLSTFNHNEFFPVIMVFVGHPSFLQDLRSPALSSLNQRIKRRYHLARFSFEDTKNYIFFRLLKSGATGIPAFPPETVQRIFEYSGGIPRLINNICDTCLLIGASKKMGAILPDVVEEAKKLVDGSLAEVQAGPPAAAQTPARMESPAVLPDGPPSGTAPAGEPIYSQGVDIEEYQEEAPPPRATRPGGKAGRLLAVVLVVVLLLFAVLWTQSRMGDGKLMSLFTSERESEQAPPAAAPKKVDAPPPPVAVEIPVLREEAAGKETVLSSPAKPGEGSAAETARPTAGGSKDVLHPFSLRSASFQQMDLAVKEMAEIRKTGLLPYLVKTGTGEMGTLWRVYIGFFTTEEEAKNAKASHKLAQATVQRTDWACQVAEFASETDGPAAIEKIKQAGYFPYVIQKHRNRFLAYVGAFESRADADAQRQELEKKGIGSQVVKR